ncbi:MAG: hypothetical protein HOO85_02945 [Methylotenera sp.]|nr:hypothetical protein [Methylotenera sp.]
MSTFIAVNDEVLIQHINQAKERIVYIAPGISKLLAKELCGVIDQIEKLNITVILDSSDEVCRIGYGDFEGLNLLHEHSKNRHFALRKQEGIRSGILIVDEVVLVWSPTPLSIEEHPHQNKMANGVLLGKNPSDQIAIAMAAEGTETSFDMSEVAVEVITDQDVAATKEKIDRNPPVPVDLARATKVFNSKLQFIEIEMKNVVLSRRQIKIPPYLLNADVDAELSELLNTKIKGLADLRTVEIKVPEFSDDGSCTFNQDGKQKECMESEASLERKRKTLEKRYIYNLPKYGWVIEKESEAKFKDIIAAYKTQLEKYAEGIKTHVTAEAEKLANQVIKLIEQRSLQSGKTPKIDFDLLKKEILENINSIKDEKPSVHYLLKDITFQQTKDPEFFNLIKKNVPPHVMKRLGGDNWTVEQTAVLERKGKSNDLFIQ